MLVRRQRPFAARWASSKWDVESYVSKAGFVSQLGHPVLELLPSPPASVLDLGCGEGTLSLELLKRGYEVVGLDFDEAMVLAALKRGVDARVGDGSSFDLGRRFDAVFSNAAIHWITDQRGVVRSVRRSLRPGGVFVGECGGEGNVNGIRAAVSRVVADETDLCPWSFPSAAGFRALLDAEGFVVEDLEIFDRPVEMADPADFVRLFGQKYVEREDDVEAAIAAIGKEARGILQPGSEGGFMIDYVRLRWRATAP